MPEYIALARMPLFTPRFWRFVLVGCLLVSWGGSCWWSVEYFKARGARSAVEYTERLNAIEAEGRQAGADGMPPEACPYPPSKYIKEQEYHSAWKRGWQAGFRSRK